MKFFKNLYVKFVQWLAVFFLRHADKNIRYLLVAHYRFRDLEHLAKPLLSLTNEVMRQHIINQGKSPDYVAPPPPAQDPFPNTTTCTLPHSFSSVGGEWVKDPSKHPVIQSRAEMKRRSTISTTNLPSPTHTTEIGGNAIDSLKAAIQDIEEVLQPTELTEKSE